MGIAQDLLESAESTGWKFPISRDGEAYRVFVYADIDGQPAMQISRGQFLSSLLMKKYPSCIPAMKEALEASARLAVYEVLIAYEECGRLALPTFIRGSDPCANVND